ncbi:hypothetical protein ACFQZE_22605 [Paenibacillus sp. GCM10027627]|uniref:hypothetical protein n=1 Tax=unclassified Paenibacillus TaxID=185978 RepID=UPI0036441937
MKRRLAVLILSIVMLLSFSSSTFALIGVCEETAPCQLAANPGASNQATVYGQLDEDWYYYTNNTILPRYVHITLMDQNVNNLLFAYRINNNPQIQVTSLPNSIQKYKYNILLPSGSTIYLRIKNVSLQYSQPYKISLISTFERVM